MTYKNARTAISLLLALTLATTPAVATVIQQPNFTGTWLLNLEQSDRWEDNVIFFNNSGTKDTESAVESRDQFFEKEVQAPAVLPAPVETIRIKHNDPEFTILPTTLDPKQMRIGRRTGAFAVPALTASAVNWKEQDREGMFSIAVAPPVSTLYTDGRVVKSECPMEHQIEKRAYWNGDHLVVAIKAPVGVKITETYSLSPNGRQLYIITRIENERLHKDPMIIRKVYDAVKG